MLDERIVEKIIERLVGRVEEMNTYILEKMGGSVKKIGKLSPTQAQQLINILKYGGDYEDIVKKIADVTEMNVADIQEIFKEVAKNDYRFAKQFYEFRNKPYIPFEENEALQNQIKALARITAGDYLNLSKTTAFSKKVNGKVVYTELAQTYHDLIDKAVLSVAQGKTAFNEQMYSTLKELASSGIKTIDYANGRSMRMDSAVRMTLKGALRNLHNETQKIIGEQFGADGVEISVHYNPAPDHAEVQGRQFSNEEFDKFQNDRDAVDYQGRVFTHNHGKRDRRSISQYNCYHYTFSIVLGVSKPQYSDEQLRMINEQNEKGFEMDGTRYTNYEGTQLQRKLETEIRKAKDTQIMARASGNDLLAQESQMRINELTYKYKELSKVSGLPTKADRLRVSGYSPLRPSKKASIPKPKKYYVYDELGLDDDVWLEYFNWGEKDINEISPEKQEQYNYFYDYFSKRVTDKDAREAIEDYTNENAQYNYRTLNYSLRNGKISAEAQKRIDLINQGIDENKMPENMIVYRAVDSDVIDMFEEGTDFVEKGFMSTSISKEKAEEFLDYMEGGIIEIKVDKGKKGVYIGEDTMSYKQEDEVLFGNGEVLYIEKVDKKNNKVIAKMK